jgi:hypothetical protein
MASRRTLRLKTREQRELEHYRNHDARPYVRERCSALLRIAAGEPFLLPTIFHRCSQPVV